MILETYYDKKRLIDETWYDSSSVYYSKFDENKRELTVVFKTGAIYLYKDVNDTNNYVMFKHGGLDCSQGKALNQYIKNAYEYEKLPERPDIFNECEKRKEEVLKLIEIEHTYFISGHRNITEKEFKENYIPEINKVLETDEKARFIMGDYYGTDIMAQNYLMDNLEISPDKVTVYHMMENPRNINPKITKLVGGFKSDEERDKAMTEASAFDIAFVRSNLELSGTAMNILRRYLYI